MRRSLAAAILGISLWIGSMAWTGFILTRTVLDPGRSAEAAETLYEDEAVRAQLTANLADAMGRAVPDGVPVEREVLEAAAADALDDPAVRALFLDTLVATHAAFLGEGEVPTRLDAGAVGTATRDALVAARPDLGLFVPESPELVVPLPTDRVPDLGPLRRVLLTAVPALALAAAIGAVLALVVTSNRPAVLRRAGFWAVGLSAGVLVFAYGIPAVAQRWAPNQAEVIGALIAAMAAAARGPALALGACGLGGLAVSVLWRIAPTGVGDDTPRRVAPRPEPAPGPGLGQPAPGRRRDIPQPYRRAPGGSAVPSSRPPPPPTGSAPAPQAHRPADPTIVHGDRTIVTDDATGVVPQSADSGAQPPADEASSVFAEHARPARPTGLRGDHVPGVGLVLAADEEIPPEARWVPGHGFVVPD